MSETKPETGATPDPSSRRKRRRTHQLLLFAVLLVLLAAGGGAAWKFTPGLRKQAEQIVGMQGKAAGPTHTRPDYVDLQEMAVTLPNNGHPRQMRIRITLELAPDAPATATADVLSPRVYDALLTYLRTLRDGEVDSGLGLDRLRGDLYRRLDLVLGPGVLRDVLITSLVLA